jgi:cysteine synthase A
MYSVIGNTPLIRLNSISDMTGCEILAKAEFMNPGGSIKDRTVLGIIRDAEKKGILQPDSVIVEATTENFGVSLVLLCNSLNYKCSIVIPENENNEKIKLMEKFGANIIKVPVVPETDDNHYTKIPQKMVDQFSNVFWCNYFNNIINKETHMNSTAVEIWNQTNGKIDAWVCSTKSGGTYSGVSSFLKNKDKNIKCIVVDSSGSIIFNWTTLGEKIVRGNLSIEEIGNTKITPNLNHSFIDDAVFVELRECIHNMNYILKNEGLYLGPVSGANVHGAVETAKRLGPGNTIVTVLCDSGDRYSSTFYNEDWLKSKKIKLESMV